MLQNACLFAKVGADTAENEQHFAEILPKTGNYPTGPPGRFPPFKETATDLRGEGAAALGNCELAVEPGREGARRRRA